MQAGDEQVQAPAGVPRGSTDPSTLLSGSSHFGQSLFWGCLNGEDKHLLGGCTHAEFSGNGNPGASDKAPLGSLIPSHLPQILICKSAKPWLAEMPGVTCFGALSL